MKAFYFIVSFVTIIVFLACKKHDFNNLSFFYHNILEEYNNTESQFTCLTYNIQLGFDANEDPWNKKNRGGDTTKVKELIKAFSSINAAVIALQEVPLNRLNTDINNLVKSLAEKGNYNYAFGSHGYNLPGKAGLKRNGEWGNAILSKFPIVYAENKEISFKSKWQRRSVLRADIQLSDSLIISVFSLHFDSRYNYEEYLSYVKNTIQFVEETDFPVIIMGDFNANYLYSGLKQIRNNYIYSLNNFGGIIDMIFIDKEHLKVKSFGKLDNMYDAISDHKGFYSILEIE